MSSVRKWFSKWTTPSSREHYFLELNTIATRVFQITKLITRPIQHSRLCSRQKNKPKKSNLKFSPTEKLLLENLNQFDISISESDETEEKRGLVKNESGKLIQVAIPTYQRSEKTRRMLQVQMDELNSIQTQINKQIHQLQ
ncbi:Hypothetical_protein [Hexamita inflata]|uniref:Hypothetical_protein n=1 Tax=Hexamita inflata TaxID=28002 RepID=A0AA86UI52_9EUKA|nr:Hypothetical protein HINF_LOCUS46770 [Hexamita inflata]